MSETIGHYATHPKIDVNDYKDYKVVTDEIEKLKEENKMLREALLKVFDSGHNNDCLFCGIKDGIATKALEKVK